MPQSAPPRDPDQIPLPIALDKVTFIATMAKAFDAKEDVTDEESGSNPTDDKDIDILQDTPGDLTRTELRDAILGLNEEEQTALVALAWVGRGTYGIDEWEEAMATARSEHNKRTAEYLLGLPLLGDYLEEGLDAFGESIVDDEDRPETGEDRS